MMQGAMVVYAIFAGIIIAIILIVLIATIVTRVVQSMRRRGAGSETSSNSKRKTRVE